MTLDAEVASILAGIGLTIDDVTPDALDVLRRHLVAVDEAEDEHLDPGKLAAKYLPRNGF